MRKDKKKVVDEVWTEDHVKSYLNVRSYDGTAEDFHMLMKAYHSMRADDFELFVEFFCAEGRDVNAIGRDGRSALQVISSHRRGTEYAEILREAGAK